MTVTANTPDKRPNRLAAFARNDEGGLVVLSLFLFICMMLAVGLAIDVMRTEMARTRLQNTVDSAVLAAASMEQTMDPTVVVEDYFEKAGLSNQLEGVQVVQGVNHKTVTAHTNTKMPMYFLGMVGIDEMEAKSTGTATSGFTDVEISLVLDISGSMREQASSGGQTKIEHLRTAASSFVDIVINTEQPGTVSVSLVPYTAQVNASAGIMDRLNVSREHSFSSCVDFEQSDFDETGISMSTSYDHMEHFQAYYSSTNPIDNPGCPNRSFEEIIPFSENITELKAAINQYQPRANTAIHLGMKWGVGLLDPQFKPLIADMALSGEVDPAFAGRPYAYGRDNTTKVIVLMTDGKNVNTTRLKPQYYDTAEEIARWNEYSLSQWASAHGTNWSNYAVTKYTASQADSMLDNICTAAKAAKITIYTIGVEVSSHSAGVMKSCATSPSHYFDIEGEEMTDTFASIARQISTLRLTN
ncbi:TadE/TadG family type IV pilus assembly protein [Vannielia sp.]|uniref:TadE/TadG family type IV pilus assembly protein n=1 Tax=Vannielia sp. TaxID=2813045 RepID=UPI00261F6488|nr:TadE/TadG family type IV pilus assembly protein [Vannielia sp.]MDF1872913.1 pilus assembly protein TadG-related protein [Vannielia sp.]